MLVLGQRSPAQLRGILSAARRADPSYPEVGATDAPVLPAGYRHDRHRRRIGDAADFERAVEGVRHWLMHEGAGITIYPADEEVVIGGTVLGIMQLGPLQLVAPCRIVRVVEENNRNGFAYGTLPGHPEQGEEAFIVERDAHDTYFSVIAFSKPVDPLARLSGPIGRAIQQRTIRRYVAALGQLGA